jgi:cystathionine beta-lyase/cystathionine gamma-synthase
MSGASGLFTFAIKASKMESIVSFCEKLQHIMMAVSWGGHESLVIPKCSGIPPGDFDPANLEHRYVRMYVGLEDPAYLIADLEQALNKMI